MSSNIVPPSVRIEQPISSSSSIPFVCDSSSALTSGTGAFISGLRPASASTPWEDISASNQEDELQKRSGIPLMEIHSMMLDIKELRRRLSELENGSIRFPFTKYVVESFISDGKLQYRVKKYVFSSVDELFCFDKNMSFNDMTSAINRVDELNNK